MFYYRFINVVAKWPGSAHDSFILANSSVPNYMERTENCMLLGDSGYPLKTWLITPKLNPTTQQEVRFNHAHCKTRNPIERSFGLLKARFR